MASGSVGIELDPKYVDVGIRRWQDFCGGQVTLLSTGQSYEEVARERRLRLDPPMKRISA